MHACACMCVYACVRVHVCVCMLACVCAHVLPQYGHYLLPSPSMRYLHLPLSVSNQHPLLLSVADFSLSWRSRTSWDRYILVSLTLPHTFLESDIKCTTCCTCSLFVFQFHHLPLFLEILRRPGTPPPSDLPAVTPPSQLAPLPPS